MTLLWGPPGEGNAEVSTVMVDVVAYATVDDVSVITGYEERLGVALEVGASRRQLKAELRSYLMGSGWWGVLCAHLHTQAGVVVSQKQLNRMLGPVHCSPGLERQLRLD